MRQRLASKLLILVGIVGCTTAADAARSGTGFAVGNGNTVITNFHVVEGCKNTNIVNVGPGLVTAVDPNHDIAIIQSARPLKEPLRFRADSSVQLGEEIIVIGFPLRGLLSSTPTVTTGIVSSLAGLRDDPTRLQISAPVQPGNSGGPVLDRAGNVVGMVVSKLNVLRVARTTGDIAQNVNFAIPSSIITSTLKSNSITYQSGPFDKEKAVAEIVSAASPGVVALECVGGEPLTATTSIPAVPFPGLRGYGSIAWDSETGRYGVSWQQPSAKRAAEVALSECGASGCKIVKPIDPAMCGALATSEDGKQAGAVERKSSDAARVAALKVCPKETGECIIRVSKCNK